MTMIKVEMKKGFTTFMKTERGFTLVELLVVITIIAILSTVGLVVFTNVAGSARDAKRRADMVAVAQALEINYKKEEGSCPGLIGTNWPKNYYCPQTDQMFAAGKVPTDPSSPAKIYCINANNTGAVIPNPSTWTDACPTNWYPLRHAGTEDGFSQANNMVDALSSATTWKVCATLESGVFCMPNQR